MADFGSQAIICRRIRSEFPDDAIVAEENPKELLQPDRADSRKQVAELVKQSDPDANQENILEWIGYGNGRVAQRYWTLDPIGNDPRSAERHCSSHAFEF